MTTRSYAQTTTPPPTLRLAWLAEPGAESYSADEIPEAWRERTLIATIPGTTYVFRVLAGGSIEKLHALASDPGPIFGVVSAPDGIVLAGRKGEIELWRFTSAGHLVPAWSQTLGERVTSIGWNGGELLCAAAWDNRIHAFRRADGHRLWSADLPGKADAPPLVVGASVFVATKARALIALNAANGIRRWIAPLPGPAIHPIAVSESQSATVFCLTWDGQLVALNASSGVALWTQKLPGRAAGAPIVVGGAVIVVTADGSVSCYEFTGTLRWQTAGAAEGQADLKLAGAGTGSRLLVVSRALTMLDPSNGARVTDYPAAAIEALRKRFTDAMIEGERIYSEPEKRRLIEERAFSLQGELHGAATIAGDSLVFGTDEGWVYVFNAAALRPAWRHHSRQTSTGSVRIVKDRLLVGAGQEVFSFETRTGRPVWRRNVGAPPGRLIDGAKLAVIANGRLIALDAANGAIKWMAREKHDLLAAAIVQEPETRVPEWIASDGKGALQALDSDGASLGNPVQLAEPITAAVPTAPKAWMVATRSGRLVQIRWETVPVERLATEWELALDEPAVEIDAADGFLLARSEANVIGIDLATRTETWRAPVAPQDRVHLSSDRRSVLICGAEGVRVLTLAGGETAITRSTPSPLAADWREGWLVWLDLSGHAYRSSATDAQIQLAADFDVPLARAEATADGFCVTTLVGEVGFVEVAREMRPQSSADSPAGGIQP